MDQNVMTNGKVGTWTAFTSEISPIEMKVFQEAISGIIGVNYTPVAVATQLVSGTNYRFFCNAVATYPGAVNQGMMVQIYAPLEGNPHVVSIHVCE